MNQHITWSPGVTLDDIEEQVIQKALTHFRGNKAQVAAALGISVRTVDNKLDKYELARAEERAKEDERKRVRAEQLARARGIHPVHPAASYGSAFEASEQGIRLEPVTYATPQHQVPLSLRSEVQEMLPGQAAEGRARKRG